MATALRLEDDSAVAAVATGDGIVPAALRYRPDVAILDIDLPGVDSPTAAAERIGTCLSAAR